MSGTAEPASGAEQALAGLRILDLTGGVAGPLGVLQLAEHGADVIKVEPPGGRADRTTPASRAHNRSRRSLTLDLSTAEGADVLRRLCGTADVLVESFAPRTMAGFGLDYEALRADHPHLVYCSIPAWPSGTRFSHRPGYEALVHARTGQQWENPSIRPGPVFLASPVASHGVALLLPGAVMAALLARERTGRGQHVEVSLFQGAMALTTQNWNWTDAGQFLLDKGYPSIHQRSVYECADGEWIHAATMSGVPTTRSEASIIGHDERSPWEAYSLPPAEREAYEAGRREAFARWDRAQLIDELHRAGHGAEAIVAPHERFAHPQLAATGSVVEVDDPEIGTTTQVGPVVFLEETPGRVSGPQPVAGAHTDEILRSVGMGDGEITALRQRGIV